VSNQAEKERTDGSKRLKTRAKIDAVESGKERCKNKKQRAKERQNAPSWIRSL